MALDKLESLALAKVVSKHDEFDLLRVVQLESLALAKVVSKMTLIRIALTGRLESLALAKVVSKINRPSTEHHVYIGIAGAREGGFKDGVIFVNTKCVNWNRWRSRRWFQSYNSPFQIKTQ